MLSLDNLTIKQFQTLSGIHFTTKMNGKMEGMQSLSTSVLENPHCQERRKQGNTICAHCFAASQMKCYKSMIKCFKENTRILTTELFPVEQMPIINALYFRFEAFGDLVNEIQVMNYFNLCKKNPGVRFALWTKNPWYIARAIEQGNEKPDNLQIVFSSPIVNQVIEEKAIARFPFIDKIFTVYDKETSKNVNINCGSKKCLSCGLCYNKNDILHINETLK